MKFAIPLPGTSKLETRLKSIPDSKQSCFAIPKRMFVLVSLVAFTIIVPVAGAKEPTKSIRTDDIVRGQQNLLQPLEPVPVQEPAHIVTGFKFTGNTLIKADQLQKVLVSKKGVVMDNQHIQMDIQALQKLYTGKGFAAILQQTSQDDDGTVIFAILEAKLTQIKTSGLVKTDPEIVHRLITTPTNEPLDTTKLREDLSHLYDTHLFEDATFSLEDDPNRQNGVIATFLFKEKTATANPTPPDDDDNDDDQAQTVRIGTLDEDKLAAGYKKYADAVADMDTRAKELDKKLTAYEFLTPEEGKKFEMAIKTSVALNAPANADLDALVKHGLDRRATYTQLIGKVVRSTAETEDMAKLQGYSTASRVALSQLSDQLMQIVRQQWDDVNKTYTDNMHTVVTQIATEKKLVIIHKKALMDPTNSVDVTDDVLNRLNK